MEIEVEQKISTLDSINILTAGEIAEAVVRRGTTTFAGAAGMMAIPSADGESLEIIGELGYPQSIVKPLRRISIRDSTPATVAYRRCEPEFIETLVEFLASYPHLAAMTTGVTGTRALMCIPLLLDGKAIGVFGVTYREDRLFLPDERARALTLAGRSAQALHRALCNSRARG